MDDYIYTQMVSKHFMCEVSLAKKLIKSAEINNTKKELDKIVNETRKEEYKDAD